MLAYILQISILLLNYSWNQYLNFVKNLCFWAVGGNWKMFFVKNLSADRFVDNRSF